MAENNQDPGFWGEAWDWMTTPWSEQQDVAILDYFNLNGDDADPTGLEQSTYDFSYRVFPEDLTMQDSSHYMVININVPVHLNTNRRSAYGYRTNILKNEYSKVDNLRFGQIDSLFGENLSEGVQTEPAFPRGTRRIAESIALHMPNGGLVYTEDNKYEELSMTALAGSIISSGVKALPEKLQGTLGTIYDAVTGIAKNGGKLAGYPINPRVEVLFATRPQRQWMFEVFLAPRSAHEAKTAAEIIRTLRYHAAPELALNGFAFIPPAEFDITFFRQGVENLNLPRINTCVLEKIDIDYAPQSGVYSTFKDGSPVAIRLSLGFREIEIVHKRRVLQGF